MLNNDDRISFIHQFLYNLQQYIDILEMQSRCRFVENIKCLSGIFLCQFSSQLDSL